MCNSLGRSGKNICHFDNLGQLCVDLASRFWQEECELRLQLCRKRFQILLELHRYVQSGDKVIVRSQEESRIDPVSPAPMCLPDTGNTLRSIRDLWR